MMDKPVCRLCGGKHYAREPHVFRSVEPVEDLAKPVPCQGCAKHRLTIAELRARIAELEGLVADPVSRHANNEPVSNVLAPSVSTSVSRKEYMRDLMRAKRAKAKE
jgi:hypothetical protein